MSSQRDWQRLAEYAARRRAELGLTQIEVAQRGPLSLDRVQAIEGAKSTRYRLATLVALERALEWSKGSVERILAGGEPGERRSGTGRIDTKVEMTATGRALHARPETIDQLIALVMSWLPEDPEERYAQVSDLIDALTTEWSRLRRLTGRHVNQRREVG